MFGNLLVPLDGSKLAESALPAVVYFAGLFKSKITLVHVIEKNAPHEIHGDFHLSDPKEASLYLDKIIEKYFRGKFEVNCHVHETGVENVAKSIVEHSGEFSPDLIVMCTHGKSGLKKIIFGSIAQKVINMGKVPVLLIKPGKNAQYNFRRLFVPLNGEQEHETGLETAIGIAETAGAMIQLFLAVPNVEDLPIEWAESGRLLPGVTGELLNIAEQESAVYLKTIAGKIREHGVKTEISSLRGDPLTLIIKKVKESGTDLIVLGTHGKFGMESFWSETITPRISNLDIPVLLVPLKR